jgi:DNA-binding Xre family transcriptional regulator
MREEEGDVIRYRVREIAIEKGFNQSSLAREANIGFSTVKRIFRDPYREIPMSILQKIAKTLHVSIHDLIEEEPDPEE